MTIEDAADQARKRIETNEAAIKLLESGQIKIGPQTQTRIAELKRKIEQDQAIVDRGNPLA